MIHSLVMYFFVRTEEFTKQTKTKQPENHETKTLYNNVYLHTARLENPQPKEPRKQDRQSTPQCRAYVTYFAMVCGEPVYGLFSPQLYNLEEQWKF